MHCSIKNLTGFCSTDSQELLVALSAGAIGVGVGPGSLLPATAPPWFPAHGPESCASLVEACGFARVDSVQGSGAAALGKCRRCSVQDWPPTRRRFAPTPLQKGLCECAASPARVFSAPARGTGSRLLLPGCGSSPRREAFPPYTVLPRRRGEGRKGGMREKESNRQHSGTRPAATASVGATGEWGQAHE